MFDICIIAGSCLKKYVAFRGQFLADRTSVRSVICYWHDTIVCLSVHPSVCDEVYCKQTVCKQVNRKCLWKYEFTNFNLIYRLTLLISSPLEPQRLVPSGELIKTTEPPKFARLVNRGHQAAHGYYYRAMLRRARL